MKRLVLIDGKSVFYRGYYAMGALSMSDGTPTGGIYGFAAIAMEIVRQLDPTKVVVAWDSKSSTAKRKAIFDEYKAGRVKPGDDFYAQIPYLKELVLALGWGFVECEEFEADDIIGTLALQADELSLSSGKDSLSQAITSSEPAVRSHRMSNTAPLRSSALPSTSSEIASSDERPKSEKASPSESSLSTSSQAGVMSSEPEKVASSKSSDIDQWETFIVSSDLDMLQIVDENTRMYRILKGFSKLEELDVAAVEEKYGIKKWQFLDLKALKGDASDNIPGVAGIGEKTAARLLAQFGTLDGIYEHLEEVSAATRRKLEAGKESAYMSQKLAKIMTDAPVKLTEMPDLEIDQKRILAALQKLEFRSLVKRFLGPIREPKDTYAIKGRGTGNNAGDAAKQGENGPQQALGGAGKLDRWDRADREKDAATGRRKVKITPSSVDFDQQTLEVVQELDDGTLVSWNVKDLMHKNAEVAEKVLNGAKFWDLGQGRFLLEPLTRNIEHGEEKHEYEQQKAEFAERPELYKIFVQFDSPLIPVLYKMEKYGMLIDQEHFAKLRAEFEREVSELEREVWDYAGVQFNINSPAQLGEVLFKKLALPTKGIKKTARGYSTGVKELDKLEGEHGIIGAVKKYREAMKLLSTYIAPLPGLADQTGRIHTTFNQNVTATGRLSSTNPNLQNIPVRTEVGKRIRAGFVAPKGKLLVSADYSQFELRLAAALAGDEALIEDFNNGVDIHTKTAAEAFGVAMADVTKAQRRAAKVINFGILYGMSIRGLSQAAGMSYAEAKEFIDNYFELRKPIKLYLESILRQAREKGYVETMFGRRRPTPDVLSSNFIVRTGAERAAQNMPIQGTEADLMKKAMIKVDEVLPEGARMVMQVHDSLIVECDEGMEKEVGKILKREMEGVAPELVVKLEVEVSVGRNWGEL